MRKISVLSVLIPEILDLQTMLRVGLLFLGIAIVLIVLSMLDRGPHVLRIGVGMIFLIGSGWIVRYQPQLLDPLLGVGVVVLFVAPMIIGIVTIIGLARVDV